MLRVLPSLCKKSFQSGKLICKNLPESFIILTINTVCNTGRAAEAGSRKSAQAPSITMGDKRRTVLITGFAIRIPACGTLFVN